MSDYILSKAALLSDATTNENLCSRVCRYLESKHRISFRRLQVAAHDGVIIVRGTLDSFHERQVAVACIRRVAGVRRVIDLIEVRHTPVPR